MKNIVTFIFILTTFISCLEKNKKNLEDNKSNNDTIRKIYYDSNRKLKEVFFKDSILIKYYLNGNVFSEGKLNRQNQRIGSWKFYTKEGYLSEIREYFVIKDEPYLNQNIYFSKEDSDYWMDTKDEKFNLYSQSDFYSDTLTYHKTFYAEFDLGKDTININEPWRAVCYYYTPVFQDKNSEVIVVMSGADKNFNKDFSNIQEIKKDTFHNLQKDVSNQKHFPDDDPNYTVVFGKWFKTPGKKTLRGYLSENYTKKDSGYKEKRIFFEKTIFVKDSI